MQAFLPQLFPLKLSQYPFSHGLPALEKLILWALPDQALCSLAEELNCSIQCLLSINSRRKTSTPMNRTLEVTMSDSEDWYYGLDGNPGENQYDFVSVVLHEIGHGLGIIDSFRSEEDGSARFGFEVVDDDSGELYPYIFDVLILDRDLNWLTGIGDTPGDFSNPSEELFEALTGIKPFWIGEEALEANGGSILLWAPEEFDEGVSVAHLDKDAYPHGNPNELMNPYQPSGMATHDPGPLVLAMLSDMGWAIREQTLQIPHFGAGNGVGSDLVVTNLSSTETAEVGVDVWGTNGDELDGNLVFGDNRFVLLPLGSRTLSADDSSFQTGSVTVSSNVPVSAVIRFNLKSIGIAGVGASQELREVVAPVRRIRNLSTGIAVRNVELSAQTVEFLLKDESGSTVSGGRSSKKIEARGRIAQFVQEIFPDANTTDFRGELSIRAQAGRVAAMALELDPGGVFTTLPVSPID